MRNESHRPEHPHDTQEFSRAYRPAPGPRQSGWSALVLGAVLGVATAGLVAGPIGNAAEDEQVCAAERDLWPEAADELRIKAQSVHFDHMFRAERSLSPRFGS
jgi:hypothetical protein